MPDTSSHDCAYRTVLASFNAWLTERVFGPFAASTITDPPLRQEIEAVCTRRVGRKWLVRLIGFLALTALIGTATWIGNVFGLPGWGIPLQQRITPILKFVLTFGLLSGIVGQILMRVFHARCERELWKVIKERGIPTCLHCGYSLAGTAEPRWPECGATNERCA